MGSPNLPHMHTTLSTYSNLTIALPNPLSPPFPPPSPLAHLPPHRTISIAKYVRVYLTNIRCSSVTYVTQDGLLSAFSHPLPLSHVESGNAPYASRATSYPSQQHCTFALLPPSSILTLIKILQFFLYYNFFYNFFCIILIREKKNNSLPLIRVSGHLFPFTFQKKHTKKTYTSKHSHPNSGPTPICTPIHEGSEFKTQV